MKTGVKISIITGTVLVLAVLSYYLFIKKDSKIYVFKKDEEEDFVKPEEQTPEASTPTPPSIPSGTSASSSTNPFDSSAALKTFQQWVIDVKKDSSILGGYGADGAWGRNSANAYTKYGDEYNNQTNVFDSLLRKLGSKNTVTQPEGNKYVRVVFGENMYVARYYSNKRLIIWKKSNSSVVLKGYWYDGGMRIKSTDGRNKNKTFQNTNIWQNLKNIVNFGDVLQSKQTFDDSWYRLQANSMWGWMSGATSENEKKYIIASLKRLKTNRDWYKFYEAFGKHENSDIRKWLNWELNNWERSQVNKNWKAKGMTTKLYTSYS